MISAFNNPTNVDIEYKTMFFLAMILLLEGKMLPTNDRRNKNDFGIQ